LGHFRNSLGVALTGDGAATCADDGKSQLQFFVVRLRFGDAATARLSKTIDATHPDLAAFKARKGRMTRGLP
jgi:hypothetical protein